MYFSGSREGLGRLLDMVSTKVPAGGSRDACKHIDVHAEYPENFPISLSHKEICDNVMYSP